MHLSPVFLLSATDAAHFPSEARTFNAPEIAFLGRSNVGKSSLINGLVGQHRLARASNEPGRTREVNFFVLDERVRLVDLPGYGFAQASKKEVAGWTGLTRRYLKGRAGLRRVLLLVDARHGLKEADGPVMDMLDEAAVSYQLVLTKIDKTGAAELAARIDAVAAELKRHVAAHPAIHLTSAHDGIGIQALRGALAALAAPARSR